MFNNKKDPLVDAVKKIMEQNEREREALKSVNEAFGVHSKKALPHELHGKYDAMLEEAKKCMYEEDDDKKQKLTKKQIENIASEAGDPEEIEKEDFEKLRKQKREKLEEKAPPGKKYERMVNRIKEGYSKKGGLTKKEKGIAYATAWREKNENMDESFDALNEEIRNNLLEKLNSVYETYGEQAAQYAYDTLSEEERGILGERTGTAKFYSKGPQPTPTPATNPNKTMAADEIAGDRSGPESGIDFAPAAKPATNPNKTMAADEIAGDRSGPESGIDFAPAAKPAAARTPAPAARTPATAPATSSLGSQLSSIGSSVRATSDTAGGRAKIDAMDKAKPMRNWRDDAFNAGGGA